MTFADDASTMAQRCFGARMRPRRRSDRARGDHRPRHVRADSPPLLHRVPKLGGPQVKLTLSIENYDRLETDGPGVAILRFGIYNSGPGELERARINLLVPSTVGFLQPCNFEGMQERRGQPLPDTSEQLIPGVDSKVGLLRKAVRRATPRPVRKAKSVVFHPARTGVRAATPRTVRKAKRSVFNATHPVNTVENKLLDSLAPRSKPTRRLPRSQAVPPQAPGVAASPSLPSHGERAEGGRIHNEHET